MSVRPRIPEILKIRNHASPIVPPPSLRLSSLRRNIPASKERPNKKDVSIDSSNLPEEVETKDETDDNIGKSETFIAEEKDTLCLTCKRTYSKYTCPRCGIYYCSLGCYDKHDANCTDEFYKEQVEKELKSRQTTVEEQDKMYRLLRKVHEQRGQDLTDIEQGIIPSSALVSSSHENQKEKSLTPEESHEKTTTFPSDALPEETLDRLLDALSLHEENPHQVDLYSLLSKEEKEIFSRIVSSGKLSHIVETWKPWWTPYSAQDKRDATEKDALFLQMPPLPIHLPQLRTLTSTPPSKALQFNLINILYAYVYFMRSINGDWQSDPQQVLAEFFLPICTVLSLNQVFHNFSEVIEENHRLVMQPPRSIARSNALFMLQDVADIMMDSSHILRALGDLHAALSQAKKEADAERQSLQTRLQKKSAPQHKETDLQGLQPLTDLKKERAKKDQHSPASSSKTKKKKRSIRRSKTKLLAYAHKIFFMQVWVQEQPKKVWSVLSLQLKEYLDARKEDSTSASKPPRTFTSSVVASAKPVAPETGRLEKLLSIGNPNPPVESKSFIREIS